MRRSWWLIALACALGYGGEIALAGGADQTVLADEQLLRGANYGVDGPSLVKFFRDHTLTSAQQKELQNLIAQLGDKSHVIREKSTQALVEFGPTARPILMQALHHKDPEVARRVELCLRRLPNDRLALRAAAASRLLVLHKPPGALDVLLDYLPFVPDFDLVSDLKLALQALAMREGKPEPKLIQALSDTIPSKRAVAAEVLWRLKAPLSKSKLLEIASSVEARFRFDLAMTLVDTHHAEGIPLLIDLVEGLPSKDVWRAEEVLAQIAGTDAPTLAIDGRTPAARVRQAWADWWKKHSGAIDLAKLAQTPRTLGYTLVTQMDNAKSTGSVYELGPTKQVRWKIDGLGYPVAAQVVGKDRVLVAEYLGRRVSEFDLKGKLIWERQVDLPIGCQRMPNGDTFIVSRRQLILLDRAGKELFKYAAPTTNISAACRLRNGQMIVVYVQGECVRLDETGKQQSSFPVGTVYPMTGTLDVLPNGRVLVPEYRTHKVVEYDAKGNACWSVNVKSPTSAVRLPNGNTLVVSMVGRRVSEFNPQGQEVWSYETDGSPWHARRR